MMLSLIARIVAFCLVLALTILSAIKYVSQKEPSKCEMTYMYQSPEYMPITLNDTHASRFPSYHMYLYGEGSYAASLRQNKFNGVPVLFLPGNSGSYKQVRSLASVALTKASKSHSLVHFNYFSIDFNEEYSAFYGGILDKQTEFVAICVKHILRLYDARPTPPTSVIIVGHSMGGLLARALFLLPDFDPKMISVIVTLATPHRAPVAEPDAYVAEFYARTHSFWMSERQGRLSHVNLVSIGGGRRDLMVRSDLVHIPTDSFSLQDISIISTAIPEVWTSIDHLCIVWCNQLVLTIVRATFRIVDTKSGQVTNDTLRRSRVLQEFFVEGGRGAERRSPSKNKSIDAAVQSWTSVMASHRRYVSAVASRQPSSLLLPINRNRSLVIITEGMDVEPWIFACKMELAISRNGTSRSICRATQPLPYRTSYVPFSRGFWKVFLCHPSCHLNVTHLLLDLPSKQPNIDIFTEAFDRSHRSTNVTLFDGILQTMTIDVPDRSIFYEIGLPYLSDMVPAYRVTFHASGANCPVQVGTSHFQVPWSLEDSFVLVMDQGSVHALHLTSIKNAGRSGDDDYPRLRLYLRPDCKLRVSVSISLFDTLEQLIRFHLYLLPVFLAAALLRILSKLFLSLAETGSCPSPWRALPLSTMLGDVVAIHLLTTLASLILEVLPAEVAWSFRGWCTAWLLSQERVFSFFTMTFLYVTCGAVICFLCGLVSLVMMPAGKVFAALLDWFRLHENGRKSSRSWLHFLVNVGLASMLLFVTFKTCGVVSLLALQVISALKLFHSHVRSWQVGPAKERLANSNLCRLNVCFYLLWGLIFQFSCPAFIFWMRNLRFEQRLNPDPTFVPTLFVILAMLGQASTETTQVRKSCYRQLAAFQRLFSAGILIFGLDHLHFTVRLLAVDACVLGMWPLIHEWLFGEWCSSADTDRG